MDYKKRYEVALERAKYYHSKNYMLINSAIEDIFPELAESEDERIRKELIEFLKLPHSRFVGNREHEKWIAWLERQGEKKDTRKREINDAYLQGICDAKHEIEKQGKKLNANEVIEWLNNQACLGWIEDVEVDKFVEKFKKDFGL